MAIIDNHKSVKIDKTFEDKHPEMFKFFNDRNIDVEVSDNFVDFEKFLKGYLPVRTPNETGLEYDINKTWECRDIYDKMRVSSDREKNYIQSLIYRCLQEFYS